MNLFQGIRSRKTVAFYFVSALWLLLSASAMAFGQYPAHNDIPFRFIDPRYSMSGACTDDTTCNAEADKYLQAIGVYKPGTTTPTTDRGTRSAWKASLGFSADPTKPNPGELHAVYWNAGDLELGRDMHCISKEITQPFGHLNRVVAQKYACYVTNFRVNTGTVTGNAFSGTPDIGASIANAAKNITPVATVAMEVTFTPVFRLSMGPLTPGFTWVKSNVEFIAFNEQSSKAPFNQSVDGLPFSPELDTNAGVTAQLPTHPGKASPGTCLVCHGGHYVGSTDPAGARVEGGNFLPFNTAATNFNYTTDSTLSQFSEANQREAFRQLNQFVLSTQPSATTIPDLVNGWYAWCGGVGAAGCYIDDGANAFIPDLASGGAQCGTSITDRQSQTCGWATGAPVNPAEKPNGLTHKVYHDVAAVYCRTCHVAIPGAKNVEQFNDWRGILATGQETPPLVQSAVASTNVMPLAEVPYNRYGKDLTAQNEFNSFFSNQPSACVASCDTNNNKCNANCNVTEGQCMQGAHSVSDRQECIKEKKSCAQGCGSTRATCVSACSF